MPRLLDAQGQEIEDLFAGLPLLKAHELNPSHGACGLLLGPGDDVLKLGSGLSGVQLICIEFPTFTDGRGFSSAALLRTRLGYEGPLRAVGAFLPDQMFYLLRCGFDQFQLAEQHKLDQVRECLQGFSHCYQVAADQRLPQFRQT